MPHFVVIIPILQLRKLGLRWSNHFLWVSIQISSPYRDHPLTLLVHPVDVLSNLSTQNVACGPAAAAASIGSLSEMQLLGPTPDLLNYAVHFNKIPGWFVSTLEFEKYFI